MRWILLLYRTSLKSSLLGCVKTPGLNDRKGHCIAAVQRALRSFNPGGSFHVSLKGYFSMTCGIALTMGALQALSLQEAEEIALSNNPQVKASEELIEMARQGRLDAISKWLPQLTSLTQGFKMESPIPLLMVNKPSAFLTELSLTQTLFSAQLYRQIGISSLMIEQFQRLAPGGQERYPLSNPDALFSSCSRPQKSQNGSRTHRPAQLPR
jgi:hypothetical protein